MTIDPDLKRILDENPDIIDIELRFWQKTQNPLCDHVKNLEDYLCLQDKTDHNKE